MINEDLKGNIDGGNELTLFLPVLQPLRDEVLLSEDVGSVQIVAAGVFHPLASPGVTFSR